MFADGPGAPGSMRLAPQRVLAACLSLAAPGAAGACATGSRTTPGSSTAPARSTTGSTELEQLGVDIVRFNLHWDRIERVRGEQDWEESDLVLDGLARPWHPGGRRPRRLAPLGERRRAANFAPGATSRDVRADGRRSLHLGAPVARLERAEPGALAAPDDPAVYVRQILNPAYAAIHAANPRAKVGGGVTAPRGSAAASRRSTGSAACARRAPGLDAYAHHPYPSTSRETPFADGCTGCRRSRWPRSSACSPRWPRVRRQADLADRVRLPDRRVRGHAAAPGGAARPVRPARHKAPRVDMLIHYLVKDEPTSALPERPVPISGRPKLAALAVPVADRAGR